MNNICAIVLGGLGNQLFVIFNTISYYLDNKCNDYILHMRDVISNATENQTS